MPGLALPSFLSTVWLSLILMFSLLVCPKMAPETFMVIFRTNFSHSCLSFKPGYARSLYHIVPLSTFGLVFCSFSCLFLRQGSLCSPAVCSLASNSEIYQPLPLLLILKALVTACGIWFSNIKMSYIFHREAMADNTMKKVSFPLLRY